MDMYETEVQSNKKKRYFVEKIVIDVRGQRARCGVSSWESEVREDC